MAASAEDILNAIIQGISNEREEDTPVESDWWYGALELQQQIESDGDELLSTFLSKVNEDENDVPLIELIDRDQNRNWNTWDKYYSLSFVEKEGCHAGAFSVCRTGSEVVLKLFDEEILENIVFYLTCHPEKTYISDVWKWASRICRDKLYWWGPTVYHRSATTGVQIPTYISVSWQIPCPETDSVTFWHAKW